nr:MAG TPA: hypothetical protein [Caudoviricetes sp.]
MFSRLQFQKWRFIIDISGSWSQSIRSGLGMKMKRQLPVQFQSLHLSVVD